MSKTFGSARVLDDVALNVASGEVHGLAGQNGSGKSTLIKIITGVYRPDSGAEVKLNGHPVRLPVRWPEVHRGGVSVVHQDQGLLDELSVADNICVGGYPHDTATRRIHRRSQHELASSALRRVGADIDPDRRAGTLSAPERAEVALARALRDHAPGGGLVIMDESTRALAGDDLLRVHQVLRALAMQGTSVLLISHSLPELLAVADCVSILRDGRISGAGLPVAELTESEIARRMMGSDESATLFAAPRRTPDTVRGADVPAVSVSGLAGRRVQDVSFAAARGEILGICGLPGSGYEDIPYLMTGATRAETGRLTCGPTSRELRRISVVQSLREGVVLVPEDRLRHGIALELSVRDNIALPNLRRIGRRWFVGHSWQQQRAESAVVEFGIRPNDTTRLLKTLSGGNQQKVLLAKWLGAEPSVLVLHEPTQAVDVGARRDILNAIRAAAARGIAIVLVSGEPTDLCAVCDRVLIYRAGHGVVEADNLTPDRLLEHIYGPHTIPEAG